MATLPENPDVDAIAARTWTWRDARPDEPVADRFVRLACLTYSPADREPDRAGKARAVLAEHPDLARSNLVAAVVLGDVEAVRGRIDTDPTAASAPTGPFGWSPLMYLAYARVVHAHVVHAHVVHANVVHARGGGDALGVARLLLDRGADPNDGRFFAGLATPFTVLTGVLGGGEGDQPAHPQLVPLARLLLEHGAEANDAQALYNRQFDQDDSAFELLFEFGLGRGDGGPWRQLLPDLLVPPRRLVRRLLRWALVHDQRARVALLAAHGVDVTAPLGSRTPLQIALRNGHLELADQLRGLGAVEPALDAGETFLAAALAGDPTRADAVAEDAIEGLRTRRPGLVTPYFAFML